MCYAELTTFLVNSVLRHKVLLHHLVLTTLLVGYDILSLDPNPTNPTRLTFTNLFCPYESVAEHAGILNSYENTNDAKGLLAVTYPTNPTLFLLFSSFKRF